VAQFEVLSEHFGGRKERYRGEHQNSYWQSLGCDGPLPECKSKILPSEPTNLLGQKPSWEADNCVVGQNIPFYGIWLITVFIGDRHRTLSWASVIESTPDYFYRSVLIFTLLPTVIALRKLRQTVTFLTGMLEMLGSNRSWDNSLYVVLGLYEHTSISCVVMVLVSRHRD
jgi:hypothetical protein